MEIAGMAPKGMVLVPPTMIEEPEEGSDIGVPETVITPPGVSVCPSITTPEGPAWAIDKA